MSDFDNLLRAREALIQVCEYAYEIDEQYFKDVSECITKLNAIIESRERVENAGYKTMTVKQIFDEVFNDRKD